MDESFIYFMDKLESIVTTLHPPMSEVNRFYIKITRIVTVGLLVIAFLLFKSCR